MREIINKQDKIYLSKYIISESNFEYIIKQDFTVVFKNEEIGLEKIIIDKEGNIIDFPGVEFSDILKNELGKREIEPVVKYEVMFEKMDDGNFIMVWTVRPDGRYWMDSWGFGAEDYESLSIYSYIDTNGNFTAPFKLYGIGYKFYGEYQLKGGII